MNQPCIDCPKVKLIFDTYFLKKSFKSFISLQLEYSNLFCKNIRTYFKRKFELIFLLLGFVSIKFRFEFICKFVARF